MANTFTVGIDRKNLYAKKYENKKYKGNINKRIYIKNSLIEVFSSMIESNKNCIKL